VPEVTRYFLWSLAPAEIAAVIARAANRRMHPEVFINYVHLGLIVVG